MELIVSVF